MNHPKFVSRYTLVVKGRVMLGDHREGSAAAHWNLNEIAARVENHLHKLVNSSREDMGLLSITDLEMSDE